MSTTYDAAPIDPHLIRAAMSLPQTNMRIVLHFLTAPKTIDGTVEQTGITIAEAIGMNRSLYARTIKKVVEEGWIEPASKVQNIQYYRLGEKAGGKHEDAKVIKLHRRAS